MIYVGSATKITWNLSARTNKKPIVGEAVSEHSAFLGVVQKLDPLLNMPAIDRIVENGIYIVLFSRRLPGDFHWIIGIPTDLRRGRTMFVKFHARNSRGGAWSYEYAEQDLLSTASVLSFVKIGELNSCYTSPKCIIY